jgi:acyl carrier protein
MKTLQTVQQLLAGELSLPVESLDPVLPLDELGIDSLTLIECMFKLEDKFGISVATSEINVNTLQDIADMVDRLVAEKDAALTAQSES